MIADEPDPSLTMQERRVLRLLAEGQGASAIARALGVPLEEARDYYVPATLAKLGASSEREAARIARERGLDI